MEKHLMAEGSGEGCGFRGQVRKPKVSGKTYSGFGQCSKEKEKKKTVAFEALQGYVTVPQVAAVGYKGQQVKYHEERQMDGHATRPVDVSYNPEKL